MNKKLALYKSRDFINRIKYDKIEPSCLADWKTGEFYIYFKIDGYENSQIKIGIDLKDNMTDFFEDGNIDEEKIEKIIKWLILKKSTNWESAKTSNRIELPRIGTGIELVQYKGDTPIVILKNIDYMVVEDEMDKVSNDYLFEVYFLDDFLN